MQERFIAAVDFGTSKTSLSVTKVGEGCNEVVYYKEAPSKGVNRGGIFNPMMACGPLKPLIEEAEKQLGIKLGSALVALPRWDVKAESVEYSNDRSNPDDFITEDEIASLKDGALNDYKSKLGEGMEIYGAISQSFSTEDQFQVPESDVVGMTSSTLQGKYLVFAGPKKLVANIDKAMNQLSLANCPCFIPEVEADSILSEDEKEHGVALVELGAGVTSVSIFHRGVMRSYGAIPFGGKAITNDICKECRIQERLAENIKFGYGSCMPDRLQNLSEKILQIEDSRSGESQQLPVKYLSEIIGSRMHEIAEAVLYIIGESGYADELKCGIVLTGGGAELLSCAALFTSLSGLNARVAWPHCDGLLTDGFPEIASLGGAAQIAMISAHRNDEHLICASEAEPEKPAEPEVKVEPETTEAPEEPDYSGSVFDSEPEKPASKPEKKHVEKPAKPQKPRQERKGGFFDRIGGLVGNLYENVGTDEDGENKQ